MFTVLQQHRKYNNTQLIYSLNINVKMHNRQCEFTAQKKLNFSIFIKYVNFVIYAIISIKNCVLVFQNSRSFQKTERKVKFIFI